MRASELEVGDVLPGHYRVIRVVEREPMVLVLVEFLVDGGREPRAWNPEDETPLVRPEGGEDR